MHCIWDVICEFVIHERFLSFHILKMDIRTRERRRKLLKISILILSSAGDMFFKPRRKHSVWVKPWLVLRDSRGCYNQIISEGLNSVNCTFNISTAFNFENLCYKVTHHHSNSPLSTNKMCSLCHRVVCEWVCVTVMCVSVYVCECVCACV